LSRAQPTLNVPILSTNGNTRMPSFYSALRRISALNTSHLFPAQVNPIFDDRMQQHFYMITHKTTLCLANAPEPLTPLSPHSAVPSFGSQ
jgi:hypothetical protein